MKHGLLNGRLETDTCTFLMHEMTASWGSFLLVSMTTGQNQKMKLYAIRFFICASTGTIITAAGVFKYYLFNLFMWML